MDFDVHQLFLDVRLIFKVLKGTSPSAMSGFHQETKKSSQALTRCDTVPLHFTGVDLDKWRCPSEGHKLGSRFPLMLQQSCQTCSHGEVLHLLRDEDIVFKMNQVQFIGF